MGIRIKDRRGNNGDIRDTRHAVHHFLQFRGNKFPRSSSPQIHGINRAFSEWLKGREREKKRRKSNDISAG